MTNQILLPLVLLVATNWPCNVRGFATVSQKVKTQHSPSILPSSTVTTRLLRASRGPKHVDDENENDDGWGDDKKIKELRALQQERMDSPTTPRSLREGNSSSNSNNNGEPQRDLFIPIFAVISLAGLFGAYGYEMLRLYSRGELYLPF